jgi:hypothetical protein
MSAETMNRIAKAAEQIERLEPRLAEARAELHAAIRQAHTEGAKPATIARARMDTRRGTKPSCAMPPAAWLRPVRASSPMTCITA